MSGPVFSERCAKCPARLQFEDFIEGLENAVSENENNIERQARLINPGPSEKSQILDNPQFDKELGFRALVGSQNDEAEKTIAEHRDVLAVLAECSFDCVGPKTVRRGFIKRDKVCLTTTKPRVYSVISANERSREERRSNRE